MESPMVLPHVSANTKLVETFEIENGEIKRNSSFVAAIKKSA
jgi:hypothetical protein